MRSTLRNAVVLIAVMAGGCKEDDDEPESYFDSSVLPNFDGSLGSFDASRPDSGGLGGTFDSSIQFDSSVPAVDAGTVTPAQDAGTIDAATSDAGDGGSVDAGLDGGAGEGGVGDAGGDGGPRDGGGDARVGDAGGDARVDGGGDAGPPATFTRVLAILRSNCAICHTTEMSGRLNFSGDAGDVYDRLVGVDALGTACDEQDRIRVIPGDADNSLLLQKLLDPPPCGDRMPRLRDALSPALIGEIRSWIAAGAREN